jgi:GNAT superfamily N-acetyltransferase
LLQNRTVLFALNKVVSGGIGGRLRSYNYKYVGEYPETRYVHLNARAEDGQIVGGLRSLVFLNWLRIEVLFVDEARRGQGIGAELLAEAERLARDMGAKNAALETFEFQAPAFYAKQGYQEAGRIDDYAKGFYLAIMTKAL